MAATDRNDQYVEEGQTALDSTTSDSHPAERKWYQMSASEFYVYVVALMCGISMMMSVNAVFSAPSYMMEYYLYATQDPNHVPVQTNFWNNVLTYYNLMSIVTSLTLEPLTLLKSFRRIPMLARLLTGLFLMIMEIVVLMAVPARGTSENGAVAALCVVGFLDGLGRSIFESTVYGMFGAFPSSFMSTMMGGVGISGVITSLIQIIVIAALPDTYEGVKLQSYIYYGLDVGIQGATFVAIICLRFNSFARLHFGDLGGGKSKVDAGNLVLDAQQEQSTTETTEMAARATQNNSELHRNSEPQMREPHAEAGVVMKADPLDGQPVKDLEGLEEKPANDGADAEAAQGRHVTVAETPTSNELLRATAVFETLWQIRWMFIACGFDFLITLFLFPNIAVGMFPESKWYATVAVFLFNVFDVFGRFSPSLKFMWPKGYDQRWIIVAASFARVIFVPLILLHSYHIIPSEAYGYVMEVIFGYSNGYVGSMALVLGPQSRGIDNDGKRFVAGTLMGISIQVGGTIGTVLSIMTETIRERY